jgi:hypothetical protein
MNLRFLSIVQTSLIVALSCTATYSFQKSFAYPYVEDAVSHIPDSPEIRVILLLATIGIGAIAVFRKNWPAAAIWLVLLLCLARVVPIWLGLGMECILLGVVLVVRRRHVWGFLGFLWALYFPSLMAFSSANWLWFWHDFAWKTGLTFAPMAALGAWLMVGFLALRYTTQFTESGKQLISQGYESTEISHWCINKLAFTLLVLLSAALTTAVIIGSAYGLDRLVAGHLAGAPFKEILFGIGGSAVLLAAVYYVLMARKPG